ncbi:Protein serine/threonine phosphatase PrpC, regulation of stationary phase [Olavius algarvensis associated proteobacterium Delta 3]|nr:Protein serine/threonine phosphatase PrpC, regulation of stationary phase [Olavius algarvensis associated proteobacterium Delta 3]
MIVVESAGITDVGRKRKSNEDSLFVDDDLGLYMVADGMGGHRAGEVASELVVETIQAYITQIHRNSSRAESETADSALSKETNHLLASIHLANKGVHQIAQSNDAYRGMGSTVSAAYLTDQTVIAANVGDSPIYLIHDSTIELLSVTHNVVTEQAAIDPDAADKLGEDVKFLLTRAMGVEESVRPDICEVPIFRDDVLVISSDGLSDLASPEEILDVVEEQSSATACQKLIEMANGRGGHDNVTVVVLRIKDTKKRGGITKLRTRVARRIIHFLEKYI